MAHGNIYWTQQGNLSKCENHYWLVSKKSLSKYCKVRIGRQDLCLNYLFFPFEFAPVYAESTK